MCLRLAIEYPERVIENGRFYDNEYMITHNGLGGRCGYVKVDPGHPWHGKSLEDTEEMIIHVHGGITMAEADISCANPGPDSGWWFGFDCGHGFDDPDFDLPWEDESMKDFYRSRQEITRARFDTIFGVGNGPVKHVWTTEEVREECRLLSYQASHLVVAGAIH